MSARREFSERYEGLGVVLRYDPLTRRTPEQDNVMPILHEEHVVTWELLGKSVLAAAARPDPSAKISFLDVGTGSGIWTVLVAKALHKTAASGENRQLVAIDKVPRMVEACRQNIALNLLDLDIKVLEKEYGPSTIGDGAVRAVFMNPPYHIYPDLPKVRNEIPWHARGGPHGWEEFQRWLRAADRDLAAEASLFFHHMCLGDEKGPAWEKFIPQLIEGVVSITAYDILERCETVKFLQALYGSDYSDFVHATSERYPKLYFNSGIVTRRVGYGGPASITRALVGSERLAQRGWKDREQLHRMIGGRA